jgi:hypothetical protein
MYRFKTEAEFVMAKIVSTPQIPARQIRIGLPLARKEICIEHHFFGKVISVDVCKLNVACPVYSPGFPHYFSEYFPSVPALTEFLSVCCMRCIEETANTAEPVTKIRMPESSVSETWVVETAEKPKCTCRWADVYAYGCKCGGV